jgi:hypothetical protein
LFLKKSIPYLVFFAATLLICAAAVAGTPGPILQVRVEESGGTAAVTGFRMTIGYPDPESGGEKSVQLLDGTGRVILDRNFTVNHVIDVPPAPDGTMTPPVFAHTSGRTVNIPLLANAAGVRLVSGKASEEFAISGLHLSMPAAPTPVLVHQGCPDADKCFKILYISQAYTGGEMSGFASVVDSMVQFMFAREPYAGISERVNVYRLDSTDDLGCYYNCAGIQRLICCDDYAVTSAAAAAPHDELVVVVNNDEYGGSGMLDYTECFDPSTYAVTFKDTSYYAREVMVHETGHSMAGVWDEYEYGEAGDYGDGPNCIKDSSCSLWSGTPGTGCYAGCSYDGMYRPTTNGCLMRSLNPSGGYNYCPVCINHFKDKIASCIGFPDTDGGTVDAGPKDGGSKDGGSKDGGTKDGGIKDSGAPVDSGSLEDSGEQADGGVGEDSGTAEDSGTIVDSGAPMDEDAGPDSGSPESCDCDLTYACDPDCPCDPECAAQPATSGCSCSTVGY